MSKRRLAPKGATVFPSGTPRVQEIEFLSSLDFLEALSPITGLLAISDCVYRGHGSADWSLIPSISRAQLPTVGENEGRIPGSYGAQVFSEAMIILDFIEAADRHGLEIPGGFDEVWRELHRYVIPTEDADPELTRFWPPAKAIPSLALAQHHGVPTRLLDWTTNPYVAAYFAASFTLVEKPPDKLAVWCYEYQDLLDIPRHEVQPGTVRLDVPPYAGNENLRSQSGMMMVVSHDLGMNDEFVSKPYENMISEEFDIDQTPSGPLFYKFTLSHDQAPSLLYMLRKFGMSNATLFPGYDGAARDAIELNLLRARNQSTANWTESYTSILEKQRLRIDRIRESHRIKPVWFGDKYVERYRSRQRFYIEQEAEPEP